MAELVPFTRAPDPDLVRMLEATLAQAKAGEATGILLLVQDRDGGVAYKLAGIRDRFLHLGLLSHAMHRLQADD